jgi:hypothetical protein
MRNTVVKNSRERAEPRHMAKPSHRVLPSTVTRITIPAITSTSGSP